MLTSHFCSLGSMAFKLGIWSRELWLFFHQLYRILSCHLYTFCPVSNLLGLACHIKANQPTNKWKIISQMLKIPKIRLSRFHKRGSHKLVFLQRLHFVYFFVKNLPDSMYTVHIPLRGGGSLSAVSVSQMQSPIYNLGLSRRRIEADLTLYHISYS